MDITPLISPDQKIIQSYGKGYIKIKGEQFQTPVIVRPDSVEPWNITKPVSEMILNDFLKICDGTDKPEVFIIGCGDKSVFISPLLRSQLKENGLPLEAMDTGAACRTYNVLLTEGRQVAACIIPL